MISKKYNKKYLAYYCNSNDAGNVVLHHSAEVDGLYYYCCTSMKLRSGLSVCRTCCLGNGVVQLLGEQGTNIVTLENKITCRTSLFSPPLSLNVTVTL